MGARISRAAAATAANVIAPLPARELWLEVSNIRYISTGSLQPLLEVQLKAQRADSEERSWWPVNQGGLDPAVYFKTLTEGLDKKRSVLVRISASGGRIVADALRLDYVT